MSTDSKAGNTLTLRDTVNSDNLASEISNKWEMWNNARSTVKQRWSETIEYLYATSTRETSNSQNNWSHSTHVPKLTQIADNLLANYMYALFPHDAWMKWYGKDAPSETLAQRKVIESYLQTKHRESDFIPTFRQLVNDWIIFGNTFCAVDYVSSFNNRGLDKVEDYSGPKLIRISPYDIVFNPEASDFKHSPKIIRRTRTIGSLYREAEEWPERTYASEAIKKIEKYRPTMNEWAENEDHKNRQLQFDGYGSMSEYLQSGNVEVLEMYGDIYDSHNQKFKKNHVITIIDRCWVVRDEPLNTYSGFPNIFHCAWRTRPDNIWGMGPLDNLVGMQYLMDHLENARADAFDQMIMPTRVITGDVEKKSVFPGKPGGEYRIPTGEGSVANLAPDTTVLHSDMQIHRKAEQMEMYAGSPKESMGIRTPGEKTATEVNRLATAASRIFQNKTNYLEEQFLEPIINSEVGVAIRNMSGSDVIRTVDDELGVALFESVTAEDITAKGKLVPIGARHFERQNQLTQNLQMASQVIGNDPLTAQHFSSITLAETWSDLLGLDKFDLVKPYVRVSEKQELQRREQSAQDQVQAEGMTNPQDQEPEQQVMPPNAQ